MRTNSQAEEMIRTPNREEGICWSSIWAGVLTALVVGILFNLLGAAIGFSAFVPRKEALWPLGIGTLIWLISVGIITMYVGGWVAGRFCTTQRKPMGIIYGVMVSGISTLLSLILMVITVGTILSNSFSVLGSIISASSATITEGASMIDKGIKGIVNLSPELGDKVKQIMPDLQPVKDKINQQASEWLSKNGVPEEKIKSSLEKLIQAYLEPNANMDLNEAKNKLVDTLVQETGKNPEEIKKTIEDWQTLYTEAKDKAVQMALETSKKITNTISQISLVNFFILLSGILAAIAGASCGIRNKYAGTNKVF